MCHINDNFQQMDNISQTPNITEALQAELDTISLLLIRGLQELQAMDMDYGSYFMPSQTLSQGLERMMKVLLFMSNNVESREFKKKSHDLKIFWDKLKECNIVRSVSDPFFEDILNILSKFGLYARYYYIDILGGKPSDFNPQLEWEKLESKFLDEDPQRYKMLTNGDDANNLIKEMIRHFQISIEKIINSLSIAVVNYARINDGAGWVVPPTIRAFANLTDNDFGKNVYQKWPNCLEYVAHPHKRTWFDSLIRLFHPFRKSRVIHKSNYSGRWPFRNIEEVIIEKRFSLKGTFYVITINGYDCALNGDTYEKLHLARPYDAGLAVRGITIQPFLDMAMKL